MTLSKVITQEVPPQNEGYSQACLLGPATDKEEYPQSQEAKTSWLVGATAVGGEVPLSTKEKIRRAAVIRGILFSPLLDLQSASAQSGIVGPERAIWKEPGCCVP